MAGQLGEFTLGDAVINIMGRVGPGLNQALGEAESRVRKGIGNILGVASNIGKGMTVAGGAIMGALGYAAKGAADFDEALHKVNTVAKLSDDQLKVLGEKTIALSNEMGVGSVDALNAMYQALSAGVPADNVIDFMRVAAKASIGGMADLEQVVDGVTSAVNAYKATGLEAGKASDIMFKSAELGKTTFGELASSMSNVAPVAANAGVSFEEVNAAIAQLTLSGTKTAEATTQIRAAMLALINPMKTLSLR
jgi:TP901 family phage tail tape measure protein